MANYIVSQNNIGSYSVNLQSTSLVGPQGPVGTTIWNRTDVGIHTLSNVGVGTTNPTTKFEVLGNSKFYGDVNIDGESEIYFGNGNLTISSSNNLTSLLSAGYNFYIEAEYIGISSSSPQSKLDVNGDIKVGIDTTAGIILTSPNGTQYRIYVDNTGNILTQSL